MGSGLIPGFEVLVSGASISCSVGALLRKYDPSNAM